MLIWLLSGGALWFFLLVIQATFASYSSRT